MTVKVPIDAYQGTPYHSADSHARSVLELAKREIADALGGTCPHEVARVLDKLMKRFENHDLP